MNLYTAQDLLNRQAKELRKINSIHNRFQYNGYEYRFTFEGGFSAAVRIDRREIGRRNFKYYLVVPCNKEKYWDSAYEKCVDEIAKREDKQRGV